MLPYTWVATWSARCWRRWCCVAWAGAQSSCGRICWSRWAWWCRRKLPRSRCWRGCGCSLGCPPGWGGFALWICTEPREYGRSWHTVSVKAENLCSAGLSLRSGLKGERWNWMSGRSISQPLPANAACPPPPPTQRALALQHVAQPDPDASGDAHHVVVERDRRMGLIDQASLHVVLQVCADAGQVAHYSNPVLAQQRGRTDARQLQNLR